MEILSWNIKRREQGVRLAALALVLALSPARSARADAIHQPADNQVKAAYIASFGRFVKWPVNTFPDPFSPLRVVVLADEALATALRDTMRTDGINGRKVVIETTRSLRGMTACHVLVIGTNQDASVVSAVVGNDRLGTLTISDAPGYAARGVMINFTRDAGQIRFEVNLHAAARAHLKISSQLLHIATCVHPATGRLRGGG